MKRLLLLSLLLLAPAADAASWNSIDADPSDFTRLGSCGSGGVVIGDGCSPIRSTGQPELTLYGQDALGGVNSQDTNRLKWTVQSDTAFTALKFDVRDFRDLRRSHGTITVGGQKVSFDRASSSGETNTVVFRFRQAVKRAVVRFSTRLNDGFTVSRGNVCR